MFRFIYALFFLVMGTLSVSAQSDSIRVNGTFRDMKATDFLLEIERQAPVHFYFDARQLDSLRVTASFNNTPLLAALKEAMPEKDMRFSMDKRGRVFVTRGLAIVTGLPADYFDSQTGLVAGPGDSTILDANPFQKVKKAETGKVVEIGSRSTRANGPVILTGYVRDLSSGEPLAGVSVYADNGTSSIVTNQYGQYSLTLPVGQHALSLQAIGMKEGKVQVIVYNDGKLDIDMESQVRLLKEVIVSGRKMNNVRNVQMGVERLTIENIRKVPTVFGEADVLRVIVGLPGVKTVGEASTGFNVRGGSADQNLVLYNGTTIYNPTHFFGLFSAFNPEVIRDIELYKSSMPAKFGGRLASVLDITSREGNKKKLTGSAGLGPVTSRVHLEGPIQKDRTSFIFGARATYANWLLNLLPKAYKHSQAAFQDANLSISHRIDTSNNLYFTSYYSNDRFALNRDTTYRYRNLNFNLKWKHNFNNKMNGIFSAGMDQYQYNVTSNENEVNAYKLGFNIRQLNFKTDFDYYVNARHSFDFGLSLIRYGLEPGYIEPAASGSSVRKEEIDKEQALESSAYFSHRFTLNSKFSITSGLRYSMFNYLGPQTVSRYAPGVPRNEGSQIDTREYGKGKLVKTYQGPEYRISARYAFTPTFSLKAAFNTMRQYIHLLSNTTIIAPTDIWKLSDYNIRPQQGNQYSFGIYKNLKSNTIETSLEVYYKTIKDYLDYKPGATLFLNHNIERDVVNTRGKAYGAEVLIKKSSGKLNGWISYSYSRILLRTDDSTQGTRVNQGEFYPANYDKPHDLTVAGNFTVNHRFSVSLNVTYSTGRPITLPVARYYYAGSQRVLYSDRNKYRIPDYFRTDLSLNIDGNHKVNQKTHNSWTVGVYNMFARRNPYSVYFVSENGAVHGYRLSIFGSAIPFVNFNIRF